MSNEEKHPRKGLQAEAEAGSAGQLEKEEQEATGKNEGHLWREGRYLLSVKKRRGMTRK